MTEPKKTGRPLEFDGGQVTVRLDKALWQKVRAAMKAHGLQDMSSAARLLLKSATW